MIPKLLKKVIAECDLKWQCEPRTSQGKHRICRPQASDGIANRQRTHAVNSPDCQPTCIVGCDLLSESHPAEEKPAGRIVIDEQLHRPQDRPRQDVNSFMGKGVEPTDTVSCVSDHKSIEFPRGPQPSEDRTALAHRRLGRPIVLPERARRSTHPPSRNSPEPIRNSVTPATEPTTAASPPLPLPAPRGVRRCRATRTPARRPPAPRSVRA